VIVVGRSRSATAPAGSLPARYSECPLFRGSARARVMVRVVELRLLHSTHELNLVALECADSSVLYSRTGLHVLRTSEPAHYVVRVSPQPIKS